ncbi:MAG: hypothetical protein H6Q76_1215 [Firmicutes bacterium]|nr:hypothetical protein [Bacillota bacterium]
MLDAEYFIEKLGLEPHIEGGYCKELYQNSRRFDDRPISSTIYYLLKSGQVSKFHRLKSDELWFYHCGSPMLVHEINSAGELSTTRLGLRVEHGYQPQILVSGDTVFGAEVAETDSFCLVSCMVSPGFDYRDFELFSSEALSRIFPQHQTLIRRLNGIWEK